MRTIQSTLRLHDDLSARRWLVLPTDAHQSTDNTGLAKSFSQWACQLEISIDIVDRILFPLQLGQSVALVDIEIRPCQHIRVIHFAASQVRPLATVMTVRAALGKEYSRVFPFSSEDDFIPHRSSLSSGTTACAKIIQLLTKKSTMDTLAATAILIQRSLHCGRVDVLLPKDPRTGKPIDPMKAE
jgi:hypothetical protein